MNQRISPLLSRLTVSTLRQGTLLFRSALVITSLFLTSITPANAEGIPAFTDDAPEILAPDVAFQPQVINTENGTLSLRFAIKPGYYLYRDKINLITSDETVAIESLDRPPGILVNDEFYGDTETYRDEVLLTALYSHSADTSSFELTVQSQGCADIGICYPPQEQLLLVDLGNSPPPASTTTGGGLAALLQREKGPELMSPDIAAPIPVTSTTTPDNDISSQSKATAQVDSAVSAIDNTTATIQPPQTEQDRLAFALSTKSLWVIAATFFGLGLLLAFTPCVFPMVPILSSIIVGQGESITTRKAFILSVIYVLAMAVTYTLAGIAVGLSGENIQVWFQNPWVLSAFALVFVLLSLSMFGFYELQMPNGIQQRLNAISNRQQGGTYIGAGIMGFLSALIVGPCVTAPLVGALIFIADTGNAVVGGIALFALSLGMGAPLLVIGASCGKLLPHSGPWMDTTKAIFGILLLALAIWMLSRFVPAAVTLSLAAALAIISGIYLGATDALPANVSGWRKLTKGAGLISLLYGVSLLAGALAGGDSILQPLKGFVVGSHVGGETATSTEVEFQRVKSIDELNQVIASAQNNQRHVMLDFYADWCVSCKEMESFTFTNKDVITRLRDVVLVQADVTRNDQEDKALLKNFGLFGPPAIIFYGTDGSEIRDARVVGYVPADDFLQHLNAFL